MKWTNEIIEKAKVLLFIENKSYRETAELLGCSKKSLGNKFCYAGLRKDKRKKTVYEINCLFCGELIITNRADQKFCSTGCAAKYNNPGRTQSLETRIKISNSLRLGEGEYTVKHKEEFCLYCKMKLKPTSNKYCNNTCAAKHKEEILVQQWLNNKIPGYHNSNGYTLLSAVRSWVFERAKHKCEECGCDKINPHTGKSVLQIDHTDGDASNARPENLKVLCPTCHAMTPTYGYIGKRKSARYDYRKGQRDNKLGRHPAG